MAAEILLLIQANDKSAVEDWLNKIRDKPTRARIERQIDKLSTGLGVQKQLGAVCELKIDIGPGYRVYYAYLNDQTCIVLICGGDKSDQSKDIQDAHDLWESFNKSGRPEAALRARRQERVAEQAAEEEKEAENE